MVEIRRFRESDADGMQHVHTQAVQQVCAQAVTPAIIEAWLLGRSPDGYRRAAEEGGERFWIAENDEGVVQGFASWRETELCSLFVLPECHGTGLGRTLFAACALDADDSGQRIVRLKSTLNAVSFYERIGFRPVRSGFQEKRGQRIPHIEMTRA